MSVAARPVGGMNIASSLYSVVGVGCRGVAC